MKLVNEYGAMPQSSIKSEKEIIGTLLFDCSFYDQVATTLTIDDFYNQDYKIIYGEMSKMAKDNKSWDITLITQKLYESNKLEEVGGALNLSTMLTASNLYLADHIRKVKDKSIMRAIQNMSYHLLAISQDKIMTAHEAEDEVGKLYTDFTSSIESLTTSNKHIGDFAKDYIEDLRERVKNNNEGINSYLSFGSIQLDDTITLDGGKIGIIAARPGMGKTAFVLDLTCKISKQGYWTNFFSLEMTGTSLVERLLSDIFDKSSQDLAKGHISDHELTAISKIVDQFYESRIMIDDKSLQSIESIKRTARLNKKAGKCDLIIVDYLQLAEGRKGGNREQEISDISRQLKALSKELNVPVIALSQLHRQVEQRPSKRPILSDLRESGAIEQDADWIMFLLRYAYYEEFRGLTDYDGIEEDREGQIEVIIAKNRNGEVKDIRLHHSKNVARFGDNPFNQIETPGF